ncbi:unnamed protein product [Orchesella dallaii]|uniref:Uncharacterized protein n=1 Tax=Orchesella dallaii TaxID=48710 RepID=A0ABP1S7V5_9HEXA
MLIAIVKAVMQKFKRIFNAKETNSPHISPLDKWFAKLIHSGYLSRSLPIIFDYSKGVLQVTPIKWVKHIWYLRLLMLTVDNIYLLLISHKVSLELVGEQEFSDFWQHTVSRILGCAIFWLFALDLNSSVTLFNTLTITQRNWKVKFGRWGENFEGPLEKHLRRIAIFLTVFIPLQPLLPLALHFQNRTSYRYWPAHVLPTNVYNSIPGMAFAAGYDFFLSQLVTNLSYGTKKHESLRNNGLYSVISIQMFSNVEQYLPQLSNRKHCCARHDFIWVLARGYIIERVGEAEWGAPNANNSQLDRWLLNYSCVNA